MAAWVDDPSPELTSYVEHFYEGGGVYLYLWLTPDEKADTFIAATAQIAQSDVPAQVFVIPALSTLDGQDYLDVASALTTLADGQLGVALLDPPATVVAAVRAAWPDVSALVAVSQELRTTIAARNSIAALASVALYAAPLVDSSSGETVPAAVVMAGVIVTQDSLTGPWVSPAGTSVAVSGYDVVLPFADTQQDALGVNINSFRDIPHYGTVMSGARTLFDGEGREYISVSRTASWIQRSIVAGLGWTVFAPDDQAAQNSVDQAVTTYLTNKWNGGALQGDALSAAFQVTFGPEPPSNFQSLGPELWLHYGIALVVPGEFEWFAKSLPTTPTSG